MAYKVKKHCRICGKLYTPCSTCENDKEAFHWRTVACSKECGREYLKKIMESRMSDDDVIHKNYTVVDNTLEDINVQNVESKDNAMNTTNKVVKNSYKRKRIQDTLQYMESEQIE